MIILAKGELDVLSKGVRVTIAGGCINFLYGIVYSWSVFADGLIGELGWTRRDASLPFTVDIFVFSIMMAFGGRLQDKAGPRLVATLGGVLGGLGFILSGLTVSPILVTIAFGLLFGSGSAFTYAAVTPASMKWFPARRRGLITGIVVTSLGAGSLVWPFCIHGLIRNLGTMRTFFACGVFLLVSVTMLAQFIREPDGDSPYEIPGKDRKPDFGWGTLVRLPSFLLLWAILGLSIGTGHMVTAHLVQIAGLKFQLKEGYLLVSIFALANTLGRLSGGVVSDKIGYFRALKITLGLLAFCMALYLFTVRWHWMTAATIFMGLSVGALFSIFPAVVSDVFGLGDFGSVYGLLFTAAGVCGGLGPFLAGALADMTGNYNPALILGMVAGLLSLALCFYLEKAPLVAGMEGKA